MLVLMNGVCCDLPDQGKCGDSNIVYLNEDNSDLNRIINGQIAFKNAWPWFVFVFTHTGSL